MTVLFGRTGNADHTAGYPPARIAYRLTAIIDLCMDNDCMTDDWVFASVDGDVFNCDFVMGFALVIGLHVAKVAGMAFFSVWQAMLMTFGVVMTAGAHSVGG